MHWFRRDLRVAGNPALGWSAAEHGGRVLGLFCFDARFLARPDFSVDRFAFFLATLKALRDELRALGGDLLVLDEGPEPAFGALMARAGRAPAWRARRRCRSTATTSRSRARATRRCPALLAERLGVAVHTERDHLILEPEELRFFQVYSPFARRWFERLDEPEMRARIDGQQRGLAYLAKRARGAHAPDSKRRAAVSPDLARSVRRRGRRLSDHLQRFADENARRVRVPIPPAGSVAALARLRAVRAAPGRVQGRARSARRSTATSRLSIYFKNGSLTPAQAIAALELGDATFAEGTSRSAFLREIVWREFYYHVLWHRPDVETQAFLPQFRKLRWQNREDWFEAWKAGRTGYPLVDAGMRQLAETGWMHNRVRMVVASFLTQGPAHRLALGRALLHGAPARRRSRAQQRRLAVGGVDRVRSAAVLPHLQPDAAEPEVRSRRRRTCARICPSGATTIGRRFTCRASRSSITPSRRRRRSRCTRRRRGRSRVSSRRSG